MEKIYICTLPLLLFLTNSNSHLYNILFILFVQALIENIRVAMMAEEARPWDHPVNSTRRNEWGISKSTFHKILRVDLKLTPYR